jgi:hypothetical protein
MKRILLSLLFTAAALCLNSCSGLPNSGGGGGGGSATVVLTLTSLPPTMATSHMASYAFSTTVTGITLNASDGSTVSVPLNPLSFPVELNSLQSSGQFLGAISVPAGTYNTITLTLGPSTYFFFNEGTAIITPSGNPCPQLALCSINFGAGSFQVQGSPFPLTLTNGQKSAIALRLIGDNALSVSSGGNISINFASLTAVKPVALARAGTPTGFTDTVENFLGQVKAVSSNSITVQSAYGISMTAAVNSSTVVNDPRALCPNNNATTACLALNQTVSADFGVASDGKLTLLESDLIDATPADEIEGVVVELISSNQFAMVVRNKIVSSSNTSLAAIQPSDFVVVNVGVSPLFIVDSAELGSTLPPAVNSAFQDITDIIVGQNIMIQPSAVTGTNSQQTLAATTNLVRLRPSEISGIVPSGGIVTPQEFVLNPASPETIVQGLGKFPGIHAFQGVTFVDGVADTSNVVENDTISTRCVLALIADVTIPCYATKVRDTTLE